ncbi:MAG: hypothetical protein ACR2OH_06240 [Microthrixaceae bacterium]
MSSPVVVARAQSASQADWLALHLRGQGIDAISRTLLDRTAYPSLGGATVLVPENQRVEAELELMLIEQSRSSDPALPSGTDIDDEGFRPARTWIRVGSWVALAGMATVAVVPSVTIIWRTLGF